MDAITKLDKSPRNINIDIDIDSILIFPTPTDMVAILCQMDGMRLHMDENGVESNQGKEDPPGRGM